MNNMERERFPKVLFSSIYKPGRKLAVFVIKLKDVPGAIAKVSKFLSDYKVNILAGFHTTEIKEDASIGLWSFFVDVTDADPMFKKELENLRKIDVVIDFVYEESSFDSLIVDEFHFPLIVSDEESILFRIDTVSSMFKKLYELFGTGAAFMLYEMGLRAGEVKALSVREKYGLEGERALRFIMAERISKGWGIPRIEIFDEKEFKLVISVDKLFECLPFAGMLNRPNSNFFRGYLIGVCKVLFQRDHRFEEVECLAKGDECCKFVSKTD